MSRAKLQEHRTAILSQTAVVDSERIQESVNREENRNRVIFPGDILPGLRNQHFRGFEDIMFNNLIIGLVKSFILLVSIKPETVSSTM